MANEANTASTPPLAPSVGAGDPLANSHQQRIRQSVRAGFRFVVVFLLRLPTRRDADESEKTQSPFHHPLRYNSFK